MAYLPSLPDNTHLISHVWKTFPKGVSELLAFIDVTLHGPSELSISERELIFTYISALNECEFCFNAHAAFAEEYGATEEMVERMRNRDNPVDDPKLVPVFAYARKITLDAHTVR
ncbi:MAG: carboxymuconolactone decarboxylase family protein [Rhodothalassiaceae bacterium]